MSRPSGEIATACAPTIVADSRRSRGVFLASFRGQSFSPGSPHTRNFPSRWAVTANVPSGATASTSICPAGEVATQPDCGCPSGAAGAWTRGGSFRSSSYRHTSNPLDTSRTRIVSSPAVTRRRPSGVSATNSAGGAWPPSIAGIPAARSEPNEAASRGFPLEPMVLTQTSRPVRRARVFPSGVIAAVQPRRTFSNGSASGSASLVLLVSRWQSSSVPPSPSSSVPRPTRNVVMPLLAKNARPQWPSCDRMIFPPDSSTVEVLYLGVEPPSAFCSVRTMACAPPGDRASGVPFGQSKPASSLPETTFITCTFFRVA